VNLTVRVFAPELWGSVDIFMRFYENTYSFSPPAQRDVQGVKANLVKALSLRNLAIRLAPNLDMDKRQLETAGYSPGINGGELSGVSN
jgi:hypothetical protein